MEYLHNADALEDMMGDFDVKADELIAASANVNVSTELKMEIAKFKAI